MPGATGLIHGDASGKAQDGFAVFTYRLGLHLMSKTALSLKRLRNSLTVLFISPYPAFSYAAGIFGETLKNHFKGLGGLCFRVRDYSQTTAEVNSTFIRDILLHQYDIIAFSSFFWNHDQNLLLAKQAKLLKPDVITIFGGPQLGKIEDAAVLLNAHPFIDAALCGEADLSFPELAFRMATDTDPMGIEGLVYQQEGAINVTGEYAAIQDLSDIPIVFHPSNEYVHFHLNQPAMLSYQTLRGCKNACSYCLYCLNKPRFFPMKRIDKELAYICSQKPKYIRICDSHFGGTKARAMELFDIIRYYNRDTLFSIYPDPDHIDAGYIEAARAARCQIISLGIESLDSTVAQAVNRRFDKKKLVETFNTLRAYGEFPQADLIFGLPCQTSESFREDLRFLARCNIRNVLYSPLMIFPGTKLSQGSVSQMIPEKRGSNGSRKIIQKQAIIPSPQNYGYDPNIGLNEYSDMILDVEAHRFMNMLMRTEAYLFGPHKQDPGDVFFELIITAAHRKKEIFLRILECIDSTSGLIREYSSALAVEITGLLTVSEAGSDFDSRFLYETIRFDIIDYAMRMRSNELMRDIHPQRSPVKVLFEKDAKQKKWSLNPEAWIEIFCPPGSVLEEFGLDCHDCSSGESCFIFVCPYRTIYHASRNELKMLSNFDKPALITEIDQTAVSELPRTFKKWINAGVLIPEGT